MSMGQQLLSSPPQILHPPSSQPITHRRLLKPSRIHCNLSRRDLSAALTAVLLLPSRARATVCGGGDEATTISVFLDVSIDGDPAGRITVGLYGSAAPLGSARFAALVTGAAGISYRRKEFIKITPAYIQHGGVRSYGVDADLARLKADGLAAELAAAAERCPAAVRNVAGTVGILVRDPARPPPRVKVVARNGRLEVVEEEVGSEPNGSEFVISVLDSPELDQKALVVGRVVGGMDVVERIAGVKTVQENTSSPYFRVAKLIGDKRAVVAERGFNRPYSKVVITNCGLVN